MEFLTPVCLEVARIPQLEYFKQVHEFDTLLEGYDYCRVNGPNPFVVRNCAEFLSATPEEIQSQICRESSIHGYNDTGTHEVTGKVAYNRWRRNNLDFNIVDSSSARGTTLLPSLLRKLNVANEVDHVLWLSYVLTSAKVQSKCHIDPPFGSGWQFLSEGVKEWTIIDKDFFKEPFVWIPMKEDPSDAVSSEIPFFLTKTKVFYVIEVATNAILPFLVTDNDGKEQLRSENDHGIQPNLLSSSFNSDNNYDVEKLARTRPNELYRVTLRSSDFISCPEDWPHSVYTIVKTCGLSGYMKYEKSE